MVGILLILYSVQIILKMCYLHGIFICGDIIGTACSAKLHEAPNCFSKDKRSIACIQNAVINKVVAEVIQVVCQEADQLLAAASCSGLLSCQQVCVQ